VRASARRTKPHRAFDPRRIGNLECEAWIAYYRREWVPLLISSVGLTRQMFGLPWLGTLRGAWYVLRGNQLWAPAENDPAACRRVMERFYRLVAVHHGETFDPARAAELEVEWWRVHREHQHGDEVSEGPLIDALTALYAFTYGVDADAVRPAAEQRALAMRYSDQWVAAGCDLHDPLIDAERSALVRSYAALLAGVHLSTPR
jgi:hypothetical protein